MHWSLRPVGGDACDWQNGRYLTPTGADDKIFIESYLLLTSP
jgi:hypothetical protein